MRDQDPLELWLLMDRDPGLDALSAQHHGQSRASLDRLAALLDDTGSKKVNLADSGIHVWNRRALAPVDLSRGCELYRRVVVQGGSGSTFVQEGLLEMIASTKDPASIPFWLEILDIRRPRDMFAEKRRFYALAAIARIAIGRRAEAAYEALRNLARHPDREVRALAVHYLSRAYLLGKESLPPAVESELLEIAMHDPAFGPRFQARSALSAVDKPAPLDHPGGVFLFRIGLMGSRRNYRIIAVRSEQTLEHLHFAIQSAIDWDADHLYSFFLNGKLYDQRYAFACPDDKDNPPFTDEVAIGDLGLTVKHKFLYFFDYGDCHEFQVEVAGVRPEAGPGRFPCVVESHGEAPEQYPDWE